MRKRPKNYNDTNETKQIFQAKSVNLCPQLHWNRLKHLHAVGRTKLGTKLGFRDIDPNY